MVSRARPRSSVGADGLRELAIFAAAYLTYFGVRALTEGTASRAVDHAHDLIRIEKWLGIAWERSIQGTIIGSHFLVDAANAVYMYGHWPVIIVTGVLLFRYRRPQYYRLRDAFLISGIVGLAIFAVFPVAPPRLTGLLVDTIARADEGYRQLIPATLVNQYAAMPSFHAGWNLVLGIVVFRAVRNPLLRALAVAGPVSMLLAVVATANHFVIDVLVGAAIALVALRIADALERRRDRRTLSQQDDKPHHVGAVRDCPSRGERSRPPARRRGAQHPARRG